MAMGGTTTAGSAFAILESWGMIYSIVVPVAGARHLEQTLQSDLPQHLLQ
jgi:hypothetical protein